ncbi:MAG: adenylate/guanylate cyclase domain-containing protein [Burkholderiaceae bacterium]|jgi:class 3 adenylate cyclase|nr:adenylate/guanylate cyclase domain-containing protein [Burkholderiaceae bacterium]
MSAQTILFVDLVESVAAQDPEALPTVTEAVSKLKTWIGRVCQAHSGQSIKSLGTGVLALFEDSTAALSAAIFLQRNHSERLQNWPDVLRMPLRIGLSAGEVPPHELEAEIQGETVTHLALRMAAIAAPNVILVSDTAIGLIRAQRQQEAAGAPSPGENLLDTVGYRSLGILRIQGLAHPHSVFQIEWDENLATDLMTVRASLTDPLSPPAAPSGAQKTAANMGIALAWLGLNKVFSQQELPIGIGRTPDCAFVVSDQRVSRQHARIELINGAIVLTDLSTFGTAVRFLDAGGTQMQIKGKKCPLRSTGEIALGSTFADFSAPIVAFKVGLLAA